MKVLTHCDDQKVTYTNGFHINLAVTSISKINMEETTYRPDYDSFFMCAQPVIDENGLNPSEFTLLKGLFMQDKFNLKTFRKNKIFNGYLHKRDFHYLDFGLINMNVDVRRYLAANLNILENQSKQYAMAKLGLKSENAFLNNHNLMVEANRERMFFLNAQTRSKKLKNALMILLSKSTIPTDPDELQELYSDFHDTFNWKVQQKIDEVERFRRIQNEQDRIKRIRLQSETKEGVDAIQEALRKDSHRPTQIRSMPRAFE